jgi:hypothetical protein
MNEPQPSRFSELDPRTEGFPVLTGAQIDRIRALGRTRQVRKRRDPFRAGRHGRSVFRTAVGKHGDRAAEPGGRTAGRDPRAG